MGPQKANMKGAQNSTEPINNNNVDTPFNHF